MRKFKATNQIALNEELESIQLRAKEVFIKELLLIEEEIKQVGKIRTIEPKKTITRRKLLQSREWLEKRRIALKNEVKLKQVNKVSRKMARLHSSKKERAVRKSRLRKSPNWLAADGNQIEEKIVSLAKEGKRESEIGRVLRDTLGVTSTKFVLGKKISQILRRKTFPQYPSDLIDLIRRAVNLRKHIKNNSRDTANKTKLGHVESKIKRLVKYYRETNCRQNGSTNPRKRRCW